jgi:mannose-6-phosphate isomerase-like protein (cupin superfamily)
VAERRARPLNATASAQVASLPPHRGEFFRVLQQTARTQCAVMTIGPGADAGPEETHGGDQIVYVVEGQAVVRLEGQEHQAGAGTLITIPAGARHHVRNPGTTPLFFLTVYAPPEY